MFRFAHLFSVRETGIALVATAAFGLFALLVTGVQALPSAPAPAHVGGFLFPIAPVAEAVDGERRCLVTDSFGDPRSGGRRSHAGVDIMAPKLEPVVAVADGVVRRVWDEREGDCCAVSIEHEGGWRTRYIHLNNDSPGMDDGVVVGVAPGLEPGRSVRRGQVIGWVGDSGNAEATSPHLHFELRAPDGEPVDPYPLLLAIDAGC